jgi:hypothetical protein
MAVISFKQEVVLKTEKYTGGPWNRQLFSLFREKAETIGCILTVTTQL